MKLRKDRVFIAFSIVFLCALISIYTYRLIHYYNLENRNNGNNESYLYKEIINSGIIIDATSGLFQVDDEYIFRGNIENNYVLYNDILYRIIKVDKSNNIKLITDDVISSLVWGYNEGYENSYIRKWLNKTENITYSGVFENSISSDYLVNSENCIDKINNIDETSCNNLLNTDRISLLSIDDYINAGGVDSYLNIKKYYWLVNSNGENKAWFITESGGLNNTININETYKLYGIRPVITLNGKINSFGGSGTLENPYVISSNTPTILSEVNTGSYVNFSDSIYKVISKDKSSVKIVMNDFILDEDNIYIQMAYSKASPNFDIKEKNNIGYYLNNTFYDSLKNKDYILSTKWFIGEYSKENKYDYNNLYNTSVKAKIGLLNIGELFINNFDNTYSMTKTNDIEDTIYILYNNGSSSANLTNNLLNIRPAMNLNNKLKITSGSGTLEDPYNLSK